MIFDFQHILTLRLLVWAVLSISAGAVLSFSPDAFLRGLGLQALAWGLVDAAIAIFGRRGLAQSQAAPVDLKACARKARTLRLILAVNTGLDVLYIAAGWMLLQTSGRSDAFYAGTAWGILLQGGFLLLFDALHTWGVPTEIVLPEWNLFDTPENAPFQFAGGRPAALLVHGFPDSPAAVRDLAPALSAQGWTVSAILLPGYGAQISTLYQHGTEEWIAAITNEIEQLRRDHSPILLVGFSMGAGLCIPASVQAHPDGLVLLAPFWWRETLPLKIGVFLLRLFGPLSFPVGRFLNLDHPELQQGVLQLAPGLSPNDPALRDLVKNLKVPFSFLEQFRLLGRRVAHAAPHWHGPTLVIQGDSDPVVRPALTRHLLHLLGATAVYRKVPGGHNLNLAAHPSAPLVSAELSAFARTLLK